MTTLMIVDIYQLTRPAGGMDHGTHVAMLPTGEAYRVTYGMEKQLRKWAMFLVEKVDFQIMKKHLIIDTKAHSILVSDSLPRSNC